INTGVKIQKLTIENGIAKVDFDEQLENGVGGSCKVSAIRAQITQTLKQLSTVMSVIISINGRTEDILQP
ncbi:MAG: GerMN domain-containing protein, partial [Candidatus Nealsonbacteria bacterium]|nr:GerMN domain-containing protein [Candidatus Nealsonbacteria bacterium]